MMDDDAPVLISPEMQPALLSLNNTFSTELSLLDSHRLDLLLGRAFYARQIGCSQAFLIAFDDGADYDSPNFLWFRARYARFVYVDRVAVAAAAHGRGYAQALYADLVRLAKIARHNVIVCEVNSTPPNPASDAFHAALGFEEVGSAAIHGGSKVVRYLSWPIG